MTNTVHNYIVRKNAEKVTICNLKKKTILIRVKFQLYWTKSHILKFVIFIGVQIR